MVRKGETFATLGLAVFSLLALTSWQIESQSNPTRPSEMLNSKADATDLSEIVIPTSNVVISSSSAFHCPVTTPQIVPESQIPTDSWSDPIHSDRWYASTDRKILAVPFQLRVGGNKFGWLRPAGAELHVKGHRIDGDAPPMGASVPCCYPGAFQVSGLYFPTGGCWEIEANSEGSVLRIVAVVENHTTLHNRRVRCKDLANAVHSSTGIIVGKVVRAESDTSGYIWESLNVT